LSPKNKQTLEKIKDERREEIKQAALKVFAKKGMKGTKMSLIATEAGVSVGLAYRYFKSKEELFQILVQELLEHASEELDAVPFLSGTPLEQIQALTQSMLHEESRYAFMFIHQVRKAEAVPEIVAQLLEQYSTSDFYDKLVSIFVKGQEMKQFRDGDAKQLLAWYFFVIDSLLAQEQGDEVYGMPRIDFLIQLIKHPLCHS
jgi:AcrR family transcriptional regulator